MIPPQTMWTPSWFAPSLTSCVLDLTSHQRRSLERRYGSPSLMLQAIGQYTPTTRRTAALRLEPRNAAHFFSWR
ncbi:hypothetical protein XFF6992_460172 [Xanthomonas citri pv. fuscans]|nr:hypothetical protein XFF6992_460172 [Xanthomonas citri pv. fuscans]SOO34765.1 hypothetical protein XFF6994_4590004 [Xanthomonas citri pv. fuscans]